MRSPLANQKEYPDEDNTLVFQIEISPDEVRIKEIPARVGFEFDKDLTGMVAENSRIKRFEIAADSYPNKSFNEKVLISRICNLVQSRRNLKNEYTELFFPLGDLETKEKHDEDFIKNCLGEIYKGIATSNFTLIHLSRRIGMSRSSFYRKIKELTGLKPVDFMKKAKLQYAAKRLLVNSDMRVCEIAWEAGFSDIKYFSKLFAKEFGKLPSKFKGSHCE